MKKIFLLFGIVMMLVVLLGTDIRRRKDVSLQPVSEEKKPCYGYTIIEFGKGINCEGDTVKLNKVYGGQVLAKN